MSIYWGMPCSSEKENETNSYSNTWESQVHSIEWKKPRCRKAQAVNFTVWSSRLSSQPRGTEGIYMVSCNGVGGGGAVAGTQVNGRWLAGVQRVATSFYWGIIHILWNSAFFKKIFIYLTVPGLSCIMRTLSCGMLALVLWPGIELETPALGTRSLSHWTTRKVPEVLSFNVYFRGI